MDKIGICGAGLIGASWAIGFANAGYKCFVMIKVKIILQNLKV